MSKETVQLEQKNNYKNTFREGITAKEHYGTNQMENTGVPLQGFKGVPKDQGRGQFGVDIPGAGRISPTPAAKPRCTGITKKGAACKANPIRGDIVCAGHKRQSDTN